MRARIFHLSPFTLSKLMETISPIFFFDVFNVFVFQGQKDYSIFPQEGKMVISRGYDEPVGKELTKSLVSIHVNKRQSSRWGNNTGLFTCFPFQPQTKICLIILDDKSVNSTYSLIELIQSQVPTLIPPKCMPHLTSHFPFLAGKKCGPIFFYLSTEQFIFFGGGGEERQTYLLFRLLLISTQREYLISEKGEKRVYIFRP